MLIKKPNNKITLAIIVLISFSAVSLYLIFLSKSQTKLTASRIGNLVSKNSSEPTPTPFPFQELTIPYLQTRKYQSDLGDLKQFSQSTNYTSYTTSYLSDNYRINALITIPTSQKPASGWPTIIFIHGYIPPTLYQTTKNYESYVDYLARNGFVVLKIDLRGHGQSEGDARGAYYSSDYVVDTLNATTALASSDFVDSNRIGLWGHSMAGNILLRSVAASSKFKAAVIWAGAVYTYSDMREHGIDDNSYRPPAQTSSRQREREKLRELYGDFDPEHWFWKQVPATNYLSSISTPIQLNHAINDDVVSFEYSRNLNKILGETNIIHEFNEYNGGGHNISGTYFIQAMENTLDFYRENL